MQRAVAGHAAGDFDVLANISRDGIRIGDCDDLLVLVGHQDRLLAGIDAFLCAGSVAGIGSLGTAFRVADPSRQALILGRSPSGESGKTQCNSENSVPFHLILRHNAAQPCSYQLSADLEIGYRNELEGQP